MKKLLVLSALENRLQEKIQEQMPVGWELSFASGSDEDRIQANLLGSEIIFTWPWFFKESYLREASDLRWVQSFTAGVDEYPLKKMEEKGLLLTAAHGDMHAVPISEHVLGMMLLFTRKFLTFHQQKQGHSWKQPEMGELDELHGKRVGILGLGNIGREIAKKCKAMGMETHGMDKIMDKVPHVDWLYPPAKLYEILSRSDFIVIALPYTHETKGLLGGREFQTMRTGAFVINISRGGIVVEEDLVEALEKGRIAGAGLDVFSQEPLPADSPLYDMDNVVFSPHVASRSPFHYDRVVAFSLENLGRYLQGKGLKGLVHYDLGY